MNEETERIWEEVVLHRESENLPDGQGKQACEFRLYPRRDRTEGRHSREMGKQLCLPGRLGGL